MENLVTSARKAGGTIVLRVATGILLFFGLVSVLFAGWAAVNSGIGYDSMFEAQASIINRQMDVNLSLDNAYELAPVTSEFYGLLLYQISEWLYGALSGSSEWMSPDDPATYVWFNLVTLFFSLLAVVALSAVLGRVFRSWLVGAFVFAGTMSTPLWLGMSVLDYKDIPVAAGLTLISAALVLTLSKPSNNNVPAVSLASLGATLSLGGRAGSLPLIIALPLMTLAIIFVIDLRRRDFRRTSRVLLLTVVAPLVSVVVIWLTNPFARIDLWRWLWDSIVIAQQYAWEGAVRTAGQELLSTELPWWYAPAWLLANLPILTTTWIIFSLVTYGMSMRQQPWGIGRSGVVTLLPLIVQGLVLPVLLLFTSPVLYDGIRHLLFMVPALVALGLVGLVALVRESKFSALGPILAVVVVGASVFAVSRWFPYHYAFINPVAGWDKSDRNWELDYWGVSAREATERLAEAGLAPIAIIPASEPARPYGALSQDEVAMLTSPWEKSGVYVFRRWHWELDQRKCEMTFTIERDGQLLGEGGYCPK